MARHTAIDLDRFRRLATEDVERQHAALTQQIDEARAWRAFLARADVRGLPAARPNAAERRLVAQRAIAGAELEKRRRLTAAEAA